MTLETLIAQANGRGYLVNNLCQIPGGTWRANLRKDEGGGSFFAFAVAADPVAALHGAMRNAGIDDGAPPPAAATVEVEDLLG